MQASEKSFSDFNRAGVASNNFKVALHFSVNMEPQLPNEDCIIGLQEELPVKTRFWNELLRGCITLFRLLDDYLATKDSVTASTRTQKNLGSELYISFPKSSRITNMCNNS